MKLVFTSESGYKRLLEGKKCIVWELSDRNKSISKVALSVKEGVNVLCPITMKDVIEN